MLYVCSRQFLLLLIKDKSIQIESVGWGQVGGGGNLTTLQRYPYWILCFILFRGVNSPDFGGSLAQFFQKFGNLPQQCPSPTGSYNIPHLWNITAMIEISWCLFQSNIPPPCVIPCVIQIPQIIILCLPYTLILGCT